MTVHAFLDALSRVQQRHALLLFLSFGGLLFAVEALRRPPPLIVPPEAVAQGAVPQWLEEEVLYREALARGLGEGDLIVRRRLIQKMRQLLETAADVSAPDEITLRAWIEANPARYRGLERISFDHHFLSRARHGAALPAVAQQTLAALHAPAAAGALVPSDPHPAGAHQADVSARDLERLLGSALATEVGALPVGDWQTPLLSAQGAHLVRVLDRRTRQPDLDAVAPRAQRDWLLHQRAAQTEAAIAALLESYRVASP